MATKLFRQFLIDFSPILNGKQVRHGHVLRGRPPTTARNLQQRLDELNYKDPAVYFRVDIGLPVRPFTRKDLTQLGYDEMKSKASDAVMEKMARRKELSIDLNKARDIWLRSIGPEHIRKIADHYGIFEHLFGEAYFSPTVPLEIDYRAKEETFVRVYTGNVIKPNEAQTSPSVNYQAPADTLWTLAMTTPDGNMQNPNNEYCHWLIGNIPGDRVEEGQQIVDYLRPIPPRGVGYYRYVFILYKQEKPLDYSEYQKTQPCLELKERDWNTLEFYRKHQDHLTPAGLAFFQADWDSSLTEFYHSTLNAREPVFQYDFPPHYTRPQKWFPLKQPFNLYLDKYRDPKDIAEEFLLRKLKNVHPFKAPDPPLKYPNAHAFEKGTPSWLRLEQTKARLGWGRINDIE